MQRELERLPKTIVDPRRNSMIRGLVLVLGAGALMGCAQTVGAVGERSCFTIRVRLNGKAITAPQVLTVRVRGKETVVRLQGECFSVPDALFNEPSVDVSFILSREQIYISAIPPQFLRGPWDVELEDRRFGKDVVLPNHARAKDACAVVFHIGEPERIQVISPCRIPLPPKRTP